MIIQATSLMPFGGVALVSDDELITAMMRPPSHPCGGDRFVVSDKMRNSASIIEAINLGWIIVTEDAADSSDFVAQVELNQLAALVSGLSGFSGAPGLKSLDLDFHGAADDEGIDVIDGVPFLEFKRNKKSTSIWTATVPDDYQPGTDVFVEVYWSPRDSDTGSVRWQLEHKSVAPGSNLGGAVATSTLTQAAAGTAFELQTTGTALTIPAASVSIGDLLSLGVARLGKDAADTYDATARVHVVRIRYTGLIFA